MISLGIYLRIYSPFPKPLLAILYLGIGGGLLSASLHYFVNIAQALRTKANEVKAPAAEIQTKAGSQFHGG